MDLVAPQYCQVCLFSEINEQMAPKRGGGKGTRSERRKVCTSECICRYVRKSLNPGVCVCVHECVCQDSGGSTECFGILGLGSVRQTGDSGSIFEAEYEGILGGK